MVQIEACSYSIHTQQDRGCVCGLCAHYKKALCTRLKIDRRAVISAQKGGTLRLSESIGEV